MKAILYIENEDELKKVVKFLEEDKVFVKEPKDNPKTKPKDKPKKSNTGRKSVGEIVKEWFEVNKPIEFQIPAVADMLGLSSPTISKYFPRKEYKYIESRRTWVRR